MRKIDKNDIKEFKDAEINSFTEIVPESKISVEESKIFIENIFDNENITSKEIKNPHQEVFENKTYYYDDNGKIYRIDNELFSSSSYEINGYIYETDEQARIVSASGTLHIKEREGRLPIRDSIEDIGRGDQKQGDDRGHIIGDQFDGTNGLENMIPQDANINRNDYKNLENDLAKEIKDNKKVIVNIEPFYEGDSKRPAAIIFSYKIDGEESIRIFPNK